VAACHHFQRRTDVAIRDEAISVEQQECLSSKGAPLDDVNKLVEVRGFIVRGTRGDEVRVHG
jgi:hypothetical protein